MKYLLQDVNLASIGFSQNGRTVVLEFLNMSDGSLCGKLIAENVFAFNYHNTFESDEDALPTYVGEVRYQEFGPEDFPSELQKLGYGFIGKDGQTFAPSSKRCFHIRVEGGEVSLTLFCEAYHVNKL